MKAVIIFTILFFWVSFVVYAQIYEKQNETTYIEHISVEGTIDSVKAQIQRLQTEITALTHELEGKQQEIDVRQLQIDVLNAKIGEIKKIGVKESDDVVPAEEAVVTENP